MGTPELKQHCALEEPAMELLKFALSDLNLSARAYDRVLKVARTIADLAGAENIVDLTYGARTKRLQSSQHSQSVGLSCERPSSLLH